MYYLFHLITGTVAFAFISKKDIFVIDRGRKKIRIFQNIFEKNSRETTGVLKETY
jgi:hypothetical protein